LEYFPQKTMPNRFLPAICIVAVVMASCSKKHAPQTADANANKTASAAAKKPVVKKTTSAVPKVIVVNDSVAKKNIDGRLYYDLQGHRYWRNYDDGKYYLFNQSMYTDKAFRPH
jgi:hypothetical protein